MPKELEKKLKAEAKRMHLSKDRSNAFVYGTIARIEKGKKRK